MFGGGWFHQLSILNGFTEYVLSYLRCLPFSSCSPWSWQWPWHSQMEDTLAPSPCTVWLLPVSLWWHEITTMCCTCDCLRSVACDLHGFLLVWSDTLQCFANMAAIFAQDFFNFLKLNWSTLDFLLNVLDSTPSGVTCSFFHWLRKAVALCGVSFLFVQQISKQFFDSFLPPFWLVSLCVGLSWGATLWKVMSSSRVFC